MFIYYDIFMEYQKESSAGAYMQKSEILEHLRAAKTAHIKWVENAKLLINGFDMQKEAIPVNSTECQFGRWFYSDAQKLNALSNNPLECMTQIETLHFKLHDIYLQIYKIYFNEEKQGFFAKLFKKNKISDLEHEKAEKLYEKIEEVSKQLLDEINRLERRLIAIPEERIAELT